MTTEDMEELKARSQRAAAVLGDAGWVFDEFIKAETEALLATLPDAVEKREEHYKLAFAAGQIKGRLIQIAGSYNVEMTLADRRNASR